MTEIPKELEAQIKAAAATLWDETSGNQAKQVYQCSLDHRFVVRLAGASFKDGAEWMYQQFAQWISVETEGFPDCHVNVLTYSKYGIDMMFLDNHGHWRYTEGAEMSIEDRTHWLPLPSPPVNESK